MAAPARSIFESAYSRLGPLYPFTVYALTRLFAVLAGGCCVIYVNWTLGLEGRERVSFTYAAWSAISFAVVVTMLLALRLVWTLRATLYTRHYGGQLPPDTIVHAAREAILFPRRIAYWEAIIDPWITIVPICLGIYLAQVPWTVILQVCVAGFLGLACIILLTFLSTEVALQPVIRDLLGNDLKLAFEELPQARLGRRLNIGFGVTILITALMIGGLGLQRADLMSRTPAAAQQVTSYYQRQVLTITVIALTVGLAYSRFLSGSVTGRIETLVNAMRDLESGNLQRRVYPTGTDEIDRLAREFNVMADRLAAGKQALVEFNQHLERTVEQRTRQLQESLGLLQERNEALADALDHVRRMQKQLVQTEKLAALGQLVAGLAHEVNNSINPICSGTTVLKKRLEKLRQQAELSPGGLPSDSAELFRKSAELVEVIGQGAQRTARIVKDMQSFSHPDEVGSVPFDLSAVLEACVNLVCLQDRRVRQVFVAEGHAEQPENEIWIDCHFQHQSTGHGPYAALDQVFINILSNAIHALKAAGQIHITTQETVTVWLISIRDNGPGIPSAIRDRIFDPFFTTKPPGQGTGLGLSICHSIVTGIGGRIECFSQPGQFTEFLITIPREARKVAEIPAVFSTKKSPSLHPTQGASSA